MSFEIRGLDAAEYAPLFAMTDDQLRERGIIRKTADADIGYPCRITLREAGIGTSVLLLNHESHKTGSPYRSSYAIFVREGSQEAAYHKDELPPVLYDRPIALRLFDAEGMLVGADMGITEGDIRERIDRHFLNANVAYIHAHNAMHGCFVAEILRA